MPKVRVVLTLAGFLAAALPAVAADDSEVRHKIEGRLAKAGIDRTGDVQVEVRNGAAVLNGAVTTVYDRQRAEKAAAKETRSVDNRLRVVTAKRSDAEIRRAASRAILSYPYYGVFDSVDLGVDDGVVLLRGSVRHEGRRRDIEERVARLAGVKQVVDEIAVQSVSAFDDQLRGQLYRAIYGDERFVHWANQPDPPVRILVDRGRVTLTGYVPTAVDQAMLGHIARGTLAFGVENRVKLDRDEVKEPVKGTTRS
jgi:osmotically-inducible protein OsmY